LVEQDEKGNYVYLAQESSNEESGEPIDIALQKLREVMIARTFHLDNSMHKLEATFM
jgi:hypothetical protein